MNDTKQDELSDEPNNLDNAQQDDNNVKKTRNRLTKKQQYKKEREELIKELNDIIGIDEKKNYVYLYDLEHNEDVKNQIRKLEDNIAKYHKCGMWGYYSNDVKKGKNNVIGLLRSVYKDNDILITTKSKVIERDSNKINSTVYYFNKINT